MKYTYDYPMPAFTVDMVLFDETVTKVLLIQRRDNPYKDCWAFPGGFVNINELSFDAAKRELQDVHVRLKNCRKDFAHKLSTQIVKNHDIIGIESLSIVLLMQSGQTALVRSIADAGWGQFLGYLTYKAKEKGKALVAVDRWFASTQICSSCNLRHQLQLSDRVFRCECGLEIGRDVNAAINIKEEAIAKCMAAGMSVLKLVELSH